MEQRSCTECKKERPIQEFTKKRDSKDTRCKDCRNAYNREWSKNNVAIKKAHGLRHRFGITLDQYNSFFESQNGCCAICSRHQSELKKGLAVDHDHGSGEIRGLLCHNCNIGLGNFQDSPRLLERAINYRIRPAHTGIKIVPGGF